MAIVTSDRNGVVTVHPADVQWYEIKHCYSCGVDCTRKPWFQFDESDGCCATCNEKYRNAPTVIPFDDDEDNPFADAVEVNPATGRP